MDRTVKNPDFHILSADKYFINSRGQYIFDQSKLTLAHDSAQRVFTQKAAAGVSPLVVDNTNCEYWNFYYYLQVAVQNSYHIELMEPETPWKFKENVLASKNQHNVPLDRINIMKKKYETGVTLQDLLRSLNLEMRKPELRIIPKVSTEPSVDNDLIDFEETPVGSTFDQWKTQQHSSSVVALAASEPPPNAISKDNNSAFQWSSPSPVFDSDWGASTEKETKSEKPKNTDPQPQRKQKKKNKQNGSPESKLKPHRLGCPNENPSFTTIRAMYPNVNDSYLWDYFVRCKGDGDYCVNLLLEDGQTEQMSSGTDLVCTCFGSDVTKEVFVKVKEEDSTVPPQRSPEIKKKSKAEAKQIDLDEWFQTKQALEKCVTMSDNHYPDHVKVVKTWKKGPQPQVDAPLEEALSNVERESNESSSSPDCEEELHALPISKQLIMELDDQYGGGLLRDTVGKDHKFPPLIFIKRSTAHLLYLDVMAAHYSQEEESRLRVLKEDEELAKRMNNMETENKTKKSRSKSDIALQLREALTQPKIDNMWNEQSNDDFALKMSKEKLIEMFPELNTEALFDTLNCHNNDFDETVKVIKDSLFCTPEQRAIIDKKKKKVFNTPWPETKLMKETMVDDNASENLRTIDELRQEIQDRGEELKVCKYKANEAIRKKQYELASYLSNIAQFHKQKEEEAKHLVAAMVSDFHASTQTSSTSIDLHFLSQIEAEINLNRFLDTKISRLRTIKIPYEELHIITGRGMHSANGVPTIKNKTKSLLKQRKLK